MIFLLADALGRLTDLKGMQEEMADTAKWAAQVHHLLTPTLLCLVAAFRVSLLSAPPPPVTLSRMSRTQRLPSPV